MGTKLELSSYPPLAHGCRATAIGDPQSTLQPARTPSTRRIATSTVTHTLRSSLNTRIVTAPSCEDDPKYSRDSQAPSGQARRFLAFAGEPDWLHANIEDSAFGHSAGYHRSAGGGCVLGSPVG